MTFANVFSLKGKMVVITGGAGYFGRELVRGFLDCGADKVINIEYPGKGADFRRELVASYGAERTGWYEVDLYDHEAANARFDQVIEENEGVQALVNNAFDFSARTGFATDRSGVFEKATYQQFLHSFESGVYWAVMATMKFGMGMKTQGGGTIINISSMYSGVVGPSPRLYEGCEHTPNPPGYSMAKAGLNAFTLYAAAFLAPVRVNAIWPGAFPNVAEVPGRAGKSYEDDFIRRLGDRTMLNRTGEVSELVGPVVFLVSDASSYVTGHFLAVDGGWTRI